MNRLALHIARPITLWALHFIAIYALISAACAERALIDIATLRWAAGLVTLLAAGLLAVWLLTSLRLIRRSGPGGETTLARAAFWTAAIALIAILADLWPVVAIASCTG